MVMDYEALEPRTFLPQALAHHCNLTAEFPDLITAEHACQELHQAGIPDGDVVLLGQLGDEVSTSYGLCADEQIVLGTIARRIALGVAVGALAGGVLDLIVGWLMFGADTGAWIAVLAGAVFGAGSGVMVSGILTTARFTGDTAAHDHRPELDHALLGIESEDPGEIERAGTVLRGLTPVRIEQFQPVGAAV